MKAEMEKFIDLFEGTLAPDEARALQTKIDSDPELKKAYADYCAVIEAEGMLSAKQHQVNPNFTVKVMQSLEEDAAKPFFKRLFMVLRFNKPIAIGALATCLLAVFVLRASRGTFFNGPMIMDEQAGTLHEPMQQPVAGDKKLNEVAPQLHSDLNKIEQAKEPLEAEKMKQSDGAKDERVALQPQTAQPPPPQRREADVQTNANNGVEFEKNRNAAPKESAGKGEAAPLVDMLASKPIKTDDLEGNAVQAPAAAAAAGGAGMPIAKRQKSESDLGMLGRADQYANSRVRDLDFASMPQVLTEESRETYVNPGEAQRLNVTRDPVSTFSIDVDTGSYTNARRYIQSGHLPPADSVRVEEFINYFDYNYPHQSEKPFGVHYEIAPSPLDKGRTLLKLGIKARDSVDSEKPWNLIFLVDVSGSMSDSNKLGLVKQALKILVGKMRSNDRIGIVTYAGSSGVALEPTGATERAKIEQVIDGLAAGGSTYGSGGIEAAYQLAQRSFIAQGVNRVILATDGDFNVGITDREQLIRLIEEKRKSGVTLTTIGVGQGNIQEATMEQLANKGNGNYFYLDSFQEARKVFETDLAGTIEVVAKDVKLQVEFNPNVVASYRLIGYENRALKREDFNNDKVDAGEIGSGHTVTALYELTLVGSTAAQEVDDLRYGEEKVVKPVEKNDAHASELGFLKIRFKQPNGETSSLETFPMEQSQTKESFAQASADFRFATAVAGFGQLLRHSNFASGYSYQDIISIAEAARGEDAHGYRREMIELVRSAALLEKH